MYLTMHPRLGHGWGGGGVGAVAPLENQNIFFFLFSFFTPGNRIKMSGFKLYSVSFNAFCIYQTFK